MALKVALIKRKFTFEKDNKQKIELDDPNPDMSPEEVMKFYSGIHTELTNGVVEGPKVEKDMACYTIKSQVGQLG